MRLAAVTTRSTRDGYYLNPGTAGRPEPLLSGTVRAGWIMLGLSGTGTRGFKPVLQCRAEQAPGGGTTLTGTFGPRSEARALLAVVLVAHSIALTSLVVAGCVQLALGHSRGFFLFLGAFAWACLCAGVVTSGRKQIERESPMLLEQVNKVLDCTTGPAYGRESILE